MQFEREKVFVQWGTRIYQNVKQKEPSRYIMIRSMGLLAFCAWAYYYYHTWLNVEMKREKLDMDQSKYKGEVWTRPSKMCLCFLR